MDKETRTWSNVEAAEYLGLTPGTLRVWVSKKKIPYVKVGGKVRFRKSDLDGFLDANLVKQE